MSGQERSAVDFQVSKSKSSLSSSSAQEILEGVVVSVRLYIMMCEYVCVQV